MKFLGSITQNLTGNQGLYRLGSGSMVARLKSKRVEGLNQEQHASMAALNPVCQFFIRQVD